MHTIILYLSIREETNSLANKKMIILNVSKQSFGAGIYLSVYFIVVFFPLPASPWRLAHHSHVSTTNAPVDTRGRGRWSFIPLFFFSFFHSDLSALVRQIDVKERVSSPHHHHQLLSNYDTIGVLYPTSPTPPLCLTLCLTLPMFFSLPSALVCTHTQNLSI